MAYSTRKTKCKNKKHPKYFKYQYSKILISNSSKVARSFGDICAKLPRFGGNPNVLSAIPEIKKFVITDEVDFVVLACDGVFDTIDSQDMLEFAWNTFGDKA